MLFIFGERAERLFVDVDLPDRIDALLARCGEKGSEASKERRRIRSRGVVILHRCNVAGERLMRVAQRVGKLGGDRDPSHAQPVEQILENVCELGDLHEAEHPRKPLERVDFAKDIVDHIGPNFRAFELELGQISGKRVEKLFGFSREFLFCPILLPAHRSIEARPGRKMSSASAVALLRKLRTLLSFRSSEAGRASRSAPTLRRA